MRSRSSASEKPRWRRLRAAMVHLPIQHPLAIDRAGHQSQLPARPHQTIEPGVRTSHCWRRTAESVLSAAALREPGWCDHAVEFQRFFAASSCCRPSTTDSNSAVEKPLRSGDFEGVSGFSFMVKV
jgi:hypothetical protein